jgi:hypothetical protein
MVGVLNVSIALSCHDQFVFKGQHRQSRPGVHVEFLHDILTVRLDSQHADTQHVGNFLVAAAFSEQF